MTDYDLTIHQNPSAEVWTNFFIETTNNMPKEVFSDFGYMIGWFSNAMMAMHDHLMLNGQPINGDHAQYLLDNGDF